MRVLRVAQAPNADARQPAWKVRRNALRGDRPDRVALAAPTGDGGTAPALPPFDRWRCQASVAPPIICLSALAIEPQRGVASLADTLGIGCALRGAHRWLRCSLRHLTDDATRAPNRLCRHCALDRPMPLHIPWIAVPGRGVLLRDGPSEAACEMPTCLADVLQRLPPSGAPVYLPDEEAQARREAGQFRQAQSR